MQMRKVLSFFSWRLEECGVGIGTPSIEHVFVGLFVRPKWAGKSVKLLAAIRQLHAPRIQEKWTKRGGQHKRTTPCRRVRTEKERSRASASAPRGRVAQITLPAADGGRAVAAYLFPAAAEVRIAVAGGGSERFTGTAALSQHIHSPPGHKSSRKPMPLESPATCYGDGACVYQHTIGKPMEAQNQGFGSILLH